MRLRESQTHTLGYTASQGQTGLALGIARGRGPGKCSNACTPSQGSPGPPISDISSIPTCLKQDRNEKVKMKRKQEKKGEKGRRVLGEEEPAELPAPTQEQRREERGAARQGLTLCRGAENEVPVIS